MRSNRKVQSGNRIVVEFDGKLVGMIQSVRPSNSYGLEAASGLGDIHVQEHVPSVATHTLSVSRMVLLKGNLTEVGIIPQNGDEALSGLVFDFCIYDKDTGALKGKYIGCSFDSGDTDISAHRIVSASATFKALDKVGEF